MAIPEHHGRAGEHHRDPVVHGCVAAGGECPLDISVAREGTARERHPEQAESRAEDPIRPDGTAGQAGGDTAGADADRERGQRAAPPREIRALVGQARAAQSIGRLVGHPVGMMPG